MRCKGCHYSLANLTEPRCPECGRAFDPRDPASFVVNTPNVRAVLKRNAVVYLSCFVLHFICMAVVIFGRERRPDLSDTRLLLLILFPPALFLLLIYVNWRKLRHLNG